MAQLTGVISINIPDPTYSVQLYSSGFQPYLTGNFGILRNYIASPSSYQITLTGLIAQGLDTTTTPLMLITQNNWVCARLQMTGLIGNTVYSLI